MEKYYLDVVTDSGSGAYFHIMRGSYAGFDVEATATHEISPTTSLASKNVLRHVDIQKADATVTATGLVNVHGPLTIQHFSPAAAIELYRDSLGSVTWEAFAPSAEVLVNTASEPLAGRGYGERLVMTISPWKVPVDRHWWGRTLADSLSFVWLVWEGPEPRIIGLLNGVRSDDLTVDTRHVAMGRYTITHLDTFSLSSGSVMQHSLRDLGAIRDALPWGDWDLIEARWLSRSEIRDDSTGMVIDTTWSLHERIDWQRTKK